MPILNKVGQFVSTSLIRNIVGQSANKINIENIMNEGKILLMRISKGNLGEKTPLLWVQWSLRKSSKPQWHVPIPEEERKIFVYIAMSSSILRPILLRKFCRSAQVSFKPHNGASIYGTS